MLKTSATSATSTANLLATGCGTAIASVCALGLLRVQDALGGVWSVAAVLIAGALCWGLASVFHRLSAVVPSGVGLLAFLSRAFGRRAGLVLTLPYLLATLALIGVEAHIVGFLLAEVVPAPPLVNAIAFLTVTWLICRAGVRPGYRAQAIGTWALVGVLLALSVAALVTAEAGDHARLVERLVPPVPALGAWLVGVGTALFLFMGFELTTSQVELGRSPAALGRALRGSVVVLGAVYGFLALGLAATAPTSLDAAAMTTAAQTNEWLAPQLAIARSTAGPVGVGAVIVAGVLASYTSFNGALLALSRLMAALAAQGVLPRPLGRIHPRRLVPRRALAVLFALAVAATLALASRSAAEAVISLAAAAAALVYAASLLARERAPFAEPGRTPWRRHLALAGAVGLGVFGAGALADVVNPTAAPSHPTTVTAFRQGTNHAH